MSEPATVATPRLRTRLREKLPEILIEAASVVLALLLALAANDWYDRRQEAERTATARAAIMAELAQNHRELLAAQPRLHQIVADLTAVLERPPDAVREVKVNLGLSLLSQAAWQAALTTQAAQGFDFDWMTRVAQVYELQASYMHAQNAAVDAIAALPFRDELANGQDVARRLISRMRALSQLADGLVGAYEDVLEASNDAG